jgi:hypothetical protein
MTTATPVAATSRYLLLLAVLGWLVAGLVGAYAFVDHDGRQDIDLTGYLQDRYLPGARIATDELCDADFRCIQALDSETLTMRRFESATEAAAAASMLGGDVRLSGWIVVAFKEGGLTDDERSEFMAAQYCDHVGAGSC